MTRALWFLTGFNTHSAFINAIEGDWLMFGIGTAVLAFGVTILALTDKEDP